jgi:serine/threonine-protein kinase
MCGHPNVCTVYDVGFLEDGRPYIVMERLQGRSLATEIDDGRPMESAMAVDILIQALSGLAAVHDTGVVHRDVKPDNVFLAERPDRPGEIQVKVLDLGTSKPMSGPERDLTGTGIAIGTAYYMSPEQARGERDLDGRVDVYACGVMLYEMLSGQRPFTAGSEHGVLLKILADGAPSLTTVAPHVPNALDAVVRTAMAARREERFQTAVEFATALEALRPTLRSSDDSRDRPQPPAAPLPSSVRVPVARAVVSPPSEPTRNEGQGRRSVSEAPATTRQPGPREPSHTAPTKLLQPMFDDETEKTRQRDWPGGDRNR